MCSQFWKGHHSCHGADTYPTSWLQRHRLHVVHMGLVYMGFVHCGGTFQTPTRYGTMAVNSNSTTQRNGELGIPDRNLWGSTVATACVLQTLHRKAIATFCEQINKVTIGTFLFRTLAAFVTASGKSATRIVSVRLAWLEGLLAAIHIKEDRATK